MLAKLRRMPLRRLSQHHHSLSKDITTTTDHHKVVDMDEVIMLNLNLKIENLFHLLLNQQNLLRKLKIENL